MFEYPKQSELNRPIPKTKIYAHAKPSRALRERFAAQLSDIVWKYKLSPETINLPAHQNIHEIQIFSLILKTPTLAPDILRTIDRAIPSPIFFELHFEDRSRFAAAYKPGVLANRETYFETPWRPTNSARTPLPIALHLAGLYEQMLRPYIPFPPRPAESLSDHIARAIQIQAKTKECRRIEARLRRELQFNRKVEINAELRTRTSELTALQ